MHRNIIFLSVFLTCLFGLSQQTAFSTRRDFSFEKLSGSGDRSSGGLSGVTFEDDEDFVDEFSGSGSGSGEGSTKDSDLVSVSYVATINISSQAFVPELANTSSQLFRLTAKKIEHDLEAVFDNLAGMQKVTVLSFRKGSLMTTFILKDSGNSHPAEPRKLLLDTLKKGQLGDSSVSTVGFAFEPMQAVTVARMTPTTTSTTTTSRPRTSCEKMRDTRRRLAGSNLLPRCDKNGDFEALQCTEHAGTDDCWCSDLDGIEIPGSRMESPNFPACDDGYNMSPCVFQLVKHIRGRLLGSPRPRCALDGQFDRVQCQGSFCFCVDESSGIAVPGTDVRMPAVPNCDDESTIPEEPETVPPPINKWVPDEEDSEEKTEDIDDKGTEIIFPGEGKENIPVEGGDPMTVDREGKDNDMYKPPINVDLNTNGLDIDEDSSEDKDSSQDKDSHSVDEGRDDKDQSPDDNKTGADGEDRLGKSTDTETRSRVKENQILTQPGLLGGIIGGAVVLLLGLVLLIMFIVYRMRKKDEGSYPLDEPRKTHNYSYVRAPEKEYYA